MLNAAKKGTTASSREQLLHSAVNLFQASIELRPDYARAYVGQCRGWSQLHQWARATSTLKQGLEACPQDRVLLNEMRKLEETMIWSESLAEGLTSNSTAEQHGGIIRYSFSVQPLRGPGERLSPIGSTERWASLTWRHDVLGFKGSEERQQMTPFCCFSNFYDEQAFLFELPAELCALSLKLDDADRKVMCDFSEKAIMLCKAAVMGDLEIYQQILVAETPNEAKQLGRRIADFDDDLWNQVVCSVAFEVVWQKFSKIRSLQAVLLQTGDRLIVEATRADKVWGIGIDKGDPKISRPSEWKGANVLGWALMEARAALQPDM